MDVLMVIARVVHIVCGVFWAGTLMFVAIFLEPSVRAAGPPGGPSVMQALMGRRFLEVMPVVAGLTILSGLVLYDRVSAHFNAAWVTSRTGMTLTIGAIAALIAFTLGVFVMRPAAKRVAALGPALQQMPEGADREAGLAQVAELRMRAAVMGRWVAALLTVAVIAMGIARYL